MGDIEESIKILEGRVTKAENMTEMLDKIFDAHLKCGKLSNGDLNTIRNILFGIGSLIIDKPNKPDMLVWLNEEMTDKHREEGWALLKKNIQDLKKSSDKEVIAEIFIDLVNIAPGTAELFRRAG